MGNDLNVRPSGQTGIPCSLYRGGTSRGVLLLNRDLPYPRDVIERVLLRILGSPDTRQIDGLGSGNSQTSKAMLVEAASGPDDVRMTFAQVAVNATTVDWGGNCGNMTAAVGPFAIESGLVRPVEPMTVVRVVSANTGARVVVHVPVLDGHVVTEGDYAITGVPGRGARILLEWLDPGGTVTGRVLPTGRAIDAYTLSDGRKVDVSLVDAANPVAFCDARQFGLTGTELPDELLLRPDVLRDLEEIRAIAAESLGLVSARAVATEMSPGLPKVAVVAPRASYVTSSGEVMEPGSHDLQVRIMSMQTPHRSIAVSGAICGAVAASIAGTVVHACTEVGARTAGTLRIAHPYGVIDIQAETEGEGTGLRVKIVRVGRTARRIMSGLAHVPASLLEADRPMGAGGVAIEVSP